MTEISGNQIVNKIARIKKIIKRTKGNKIAKFKETYPKAKSYILAKPYSRYYDLASFTSVYSYLFLPYITRSLSATDTKCIFI